MSSAGHIFMPLYEYLNRADEIFDWMKNNGIERNYTASVGNNIELVIVKFWYNNSKDFLAFKLKYG